MPACILNIKSSCLNILVRLSSVWKYNKLFVVCLLACVELAWLCLVLFTELDVCFVGVPLDQGASNRPGARVWTQANQNRIYTHTGLQQRNRFVCFESSVFLKTGQSESLFPSAEVWKVARGNNYWVAVTLGEGRNEQKTSTWTNECIPWQKLTVQCLNRKQFTLRWCIHIVSSSSCMVNGVRRPRQIRGPKIRANVPPKGPCWRHRVCHLGAIVVAWAARGRLGVGRV